MALEVSALGLGSDGGAGAVLGQPLDFAVPLRLAAGETLEPRCVSARVRLGERELAAGAVRTALEFTGAQSARVRVLTAASVDEPVVTVSLTAGCGASVTRNFVLFADPPDLPYAAVLVAAQNPVAVVTDPVPVPTPVPTQPAAPVGRADSPAATGEPPVVAATLATPATPATPASPQAVDRNAPSAAPASAARGNGNAGAAALDPEAVRRAAQARARAREARAARAEQRRLQREAAAAQAAAAAPSPAGPRLRLDGPEPLPSAEAQAVEQALQAVAEAASSVRAMAAATAASEQRIAALERTVEQLRGEARANAQANAGLQARLADSEGVDRWFGPLLLALVVLGALAAWLAWRLAELQRLRQAGWREAAARGRMGVAGSGLSDGGTAAAGSAQQALADPPSQQMTRPIPFVTSELMPAPPGPSALRPRTAPAWPPPAASGPDTVPGAPASSAAAAVPARGAVQAAVVEIEGDAGARRAAGSDAAAESAVQRTDVLPASLRPQQADARDVSIEELIDLEQQAEFFVVLGQDDSAIDLLVDHLRNTGGGSPLPYLKLLEIYRRRGDRDAYERTRTRFNQRFNAYAPDWDADLAHGRTLEEYDGVVPRLQQVWPHPLDAMAELEALLFRKSRGELFDLPAYREVLFLYALARDLLDREALDNGTVDLLLPLSAGLAAAAAGAGAVSPGTLDLELAPLGSEGPATPIDLDLSLAEQRTSIFDPLDDPPTRPHED